MTMDWREQARAAFLSAQDGLRRVTGTNTVAHASLAPLDAALDVAEPLIRADERERSARLAEQVDAFYDRPCPHDPSCVHQDMPFAALLRESPAATEGTGR